MSVEECTVRYVDEKGERSRVYDFTAVKAPAELQRWLAAVFAAATGPRSGVKSINTANSYFTMLLRFVAFLGQTPVPPGRPEDISVAHIAAFKLSLPSGSRLPSAWRLRTMLRDAPRLRPAVRDAVCQGRLPQHRQASVVAYTDVERQQILTAVRHDVRAARARVRAGRDLLDRFRQGQVPAGAPAEGLGRLLDVIDRTGDVLRHPNGRIPKRIARLGGVSPLSRLCLTRLEAAAFCLLLTDMTGENFGTVATWRAAHSRPDGAPHTGPALALVEANKPRRGPARERMVTPLEDLPASLASVFVDGDEFERRLFRSPLRVYLLLLKLTELSRRHGDHDRAFGYVRATQLAGGRWAHGVTSHHTSDWALHHGFPLAPRRTASEPPVRDADAVVDGKPTVDVLRLRQSALERRRHPIAHTRQTLNDHYLRRSPHVMRASRAVVRDALEEQVAKARQRQALPVFSAAFVALADVEPERAATAMGVDSSVLARMLSRKQDTVLTSCTDNRGGPHAPPGQTCPASFFACLSCPNARALPHHLSLQVYVHDRLTHLRAHLNAAEWDFRYGEAFTRLTDLLGAPNYTAADRDQARRQVRDSDRHLAEDLLEGRLDL